MRSGWHRERTVSSSRFGSSATRMKTCRSDGSSSTFRSAFWICSPARSAPSIRTTRRSPAIGAPAVDPSQRRAAATRLSPAERDSRQISGDPMTRSGWERDRAERQPAQALQGRAERSASVHSSRARRSSTKAPFARPCRPVDQEGSAQSLTTGGTQRDGSGGRLAEAQEPRCGRVRRSRAEYRSGSRRPGNRTVSGRSAPDRHALRACSAGPPGYASWRPAGTRARPSYGGPRSAIRRNSCLRRR